MAKISHEKWKTYGNVFDQFTLLNLHKLASQGYFDDLLSPIAVGKESNVFAASKGDGFVIIKIYRLETCDFFKMYDYLKYDPRFPGLKKQKRKVIFSWTQREYRNILKFREEIRVPKPIAFKDNILVMEFIGNGNIVASKLKDEVPKEPEKFFRKVALYMKDLHKMGFVHGDLSEFNIMNFNGEPVFIDFSQSCPIESPIAKDLFDRDIKNMCNFFKKNNVKITEENLKNFIIGKDKTLTI